MNCYNAYFNVRSETEVHLISGVLTTSVDQVI